MRKALLAGVSALALFAGTASADIQNYTLTYSGLTHATTDIPAAYGDVVGDIDVTHTTTSTDFRTWITSNFGGDLDDAAYGDGLTQTMTILLQATGASETITLTSFLLADFDVDDQDGVGVQIFQTQTGGTAVYTLAGGNVIEGGTTANNDFSTFAATGSPEGAAFNFGTIAGSQFVRIVITETGDADIGIDNVTFQTVPEPATLGLVGLAGLALIRRRR